MDAATSIEELLRMPSPAPKPQSLACDGEHVWMGSFETQRFYGIDPVHFTVFEEKNVPGKPIGAVAIGDELRVVCSEGEDDNRFIRRYVPGHGFKDSDRVACPDDTGSFLAFDGTHIWLSQRHNKRVLELDAHYRVMRTIQLDAEIVGIVWVDGSLFLSTWHGRENGGCKLARASADGAFEYIASVPFAAISLTHDGTRFWTNDTKRNEIVALKF